MATKRTIVAILAMMVAVGILAGAVVAQGPPGDAGPPGDGGPPENVTQGPPENVTQGPPENVTTGPPEGVAEFLNTSPLGPGQVDPNSLSGKIRVESQHVDNTTVELTNDTETNTSLDITVTGNATNVTFYVQQQAVEASQDIDNLTVAVDGEGVDFGVADHAGGNWIGFEVDHFSTRTVTFTSEGANTGAGGGQPDLDDGAPGNIPDANPFSDGDGPADRNEVVNKIVEWNLNDGVVDDTEYTRDEIITFVVEWNMASN